MEVEEGAYYTIGIFKDYRVRFLEYWAWNVKVTGDLKLDAVIDGLEIYACNAFKIQGAFPSLNVYFRPMSLNRLKTLEETADMSALKIIDIAPNLTLDDIAVTLNGEDVDVLMINKVKEYAGPGQSMFAYLIQIGLNPTFDSSKDNHIVLTVRDHETGEMGMGSVFIDSETSK